jgi:acetolactate synthase-1/2/3 large subunit
MSLSAFSSAAIHARPYNLWRYTARCFSAAVARGTEAGARFVGMTGAQVVHETLREQNVDVVFGYPGGAILPVYDAIHESPHFKFILPRREDGGGHMAEGYARITGKPGVCIVTSGPGATNMS